MPHAMQRRSFPFDARSVMLFAAIAVGGATAQAQTPSSSTAQSRTQSGAGASSSARPAFGGAAVAQQSPATAFDRADANHDGRLSAAEAAALPAVDKRFKVLDRNRDGALSREEFEAGTQPS